MKKLTLSTVAALALSACSESPSDTETTTQAAADSSPHAQMDYVRSQTPFSDAQIQAVLDGDHRSEENRARDVYRNPVETLRFFGLYPEAHIIEINPGGGWYAEVLAPLMRERGQYVAAVIDPEIPYSLPYVARLAEGIQQQFQNTPALYDQTQILFYNPAEPVLGPSESADMVLTFRNVHSWLNVDQAENMFEAFYDVLKPGGTLGVVQHRAAPDANYRETSHQGYVTEEAVIMLAEDAGFRLMERSEANANPKDTRNYFRGVWTLPPTLGLGDDNREYYLSIGESDRMTLRFIKD